MSEPFLRAALKIGQGEVVIVSRSAESAVPRSKKAMKPRHALDVVANMSMLWPGCVEVCSMSR